MVPFEKAIARYGQLVVLKIGQINEQKGADKQNTTSVLRKSFAQILSNFSTFVSIQLIMHCVLAENRMILASYVHLLFKVWELIPFGGLL